MNNSCALQKYFIAEKNERRNPRKIIRNAYIVGEIRKKDLAPSFDFYPTQVS